MEKVFEVDITDRLKECELWLGIFQRVATKEIWKTNVFFDGDDIAVVVEASLTSFEELEKEDRPGRPNWFLLFMMARNRTFRTKLFIKVKKPALRLEVILKGNLSGQIESISLGFGYCALLNREQYLSLQEIIYSAQYALEEKIKTG